MPTVVTFTGSSGDSSLSVTVAESAEQVRDAMLAEHGNPFRLESARSGTAVYVNPANVAFWREREQGRASFQ
jgi:hypothetical protein